MTFLGSKKVQGFGLGVWQNFCLMFAFRVGGRGVFRDFTASGSGLHWTGIEIKPVNRLPI